MNEAAITAKIGSKEMLKLKNRLRLAHLSGNVRQITVVRNEIARVSK